MQFSVYQESHLGGRKVNQDRMGYSFTREALLMVLADGMGGHLRGEAAATITLQTMSALFQKNATPYVRKPERFLEEAFLAAHEEIHKYRTAEKLPDTPRTTVVACLVQHNCAIWAHCGDSRLYWIRRGQVLARTRDHSYVEHLIAKGELDPSERDTHPERNRLYNCLGASSAPRVEVSRQASLMPGDILLLCSDGLWSVVPDDIIARSVTSQTIVRAVPELLKTATSIGGERADNTTALAIMWQGTPTVDANPTTTFATTIMTESLPENQVTTTIASPNESAAPAPEADAFDDDEIEKAIAEIRGAIEKSSQILKG